MATTSGSWNGGEQIDEEMPEFLRIPPSDIKIGDQIGRGGFSTVHKALWRGKQYAAKIVQTADVRAIQKEVAILSKLSHPHIMGCIGFSVDSIGDPSRCMILMELMESDLRHLMNEHLRNVAANATPFSETEAVNILWQISAGMEYLHCQGVFHGDLKPSNVLVSHDRDGKLHVKITDFGVSQMMKRDPAEKSEEFMRTKHFRGAIGSRGYQAPEVSSSRVAYSEGALYARSITRHYRGPEDYQRKLKVKERKSKEFYSARADIYCFAVTCSEILSGHVPFEFVNKADIPELVLQGARPELPHGLRQGLVSLIEMCWDKTPSKRPRFSEIKFILERWDTGVVNTSWGFYGSPLKVIQGAIQASFGASKEQRRRQPSLQDSEDQRRRQARLEASKDQSRIQASLQASKDLSRIQAGLQASKDQSRIQASLQVSKDQSRKKAPAWWSRLLTRFRRGSLGSSSS